MTTKDEALRLALGVLESLQGIDAETECVTIDVRDEIAACREALAQKDEHDPVAWMLECASQTGGTTWYLSWSRSGAGVCNRLRGECHEKPLYTAPPMRQPLTDAGINEIAESMPGGLAGFMKGWGWQQFARAIERAILEKSNG